MKLYLTAAGIYAGTQAEAKRDGKGWQLEEVPTDKYGLIDYLNKLKFGDGGAVDQSGVTLPMTAQDEQDEVLEALPVQRFADTAKEHRLAERAAYLGTSEEVTMITDRIGELDGWPLGQVALAAASRLKELAT